MEGDAPKETRVVAMMVLGSSVTRWGRLRYLRSPTSCIRHPRVTIVGSYRTLGLVVCSA